MLEKSIYGFLKYDPATIWKYLQSDIDDDWFQDPIRYKDFSILDKDDQFFEHNIRDNFGRYKARKRELYHLPKGDFTLRYSLETDFYDRYMYINLVLPLMAKFDQLLSRRVFNHRYCGSKDYLFLNPIKQWEKFEGIIRCQTKDKYVLVTDVQNFFENIIISTLKEDLESCLKELDITTQQLVRKRFIIDRLIECLELWSYDGKRGLPQNRDCSSFLANIYMHSIDTHMISSGFNYYRYMDDIRVVCDDNFEARRALKELVVVLRDKHLSINGKKTKKLKPGSTDHDDMMRPNIDLKKIDSLLKTKKKANVAIGYSLLKERCLKLINEGKFEDRDFRFCINRLSKLARCHQYNVPSNYWDEIRVGIVNAIAQCPTCTDRVYDFLASVGVSPESVDTIVSYLCDKSKNIYEWQSYWLWKLMIVCNIEDQRLIERAREIQTEKCEVPDKAGAVLYLSSYGSKDEKIGVMESIKKEDTIFLQRHKWLAIKGLDWVSDDVQKKRDAVHDCLSGTYRVINSNIKSVVSPPPPTNLSDILRSVHQYD